MQTQELCPRVTAHKLKGLCIDSEAVATEWTSRVCELQILPSEDALLPTPWSEPSGTGMWSPGAPHGDLSQAQTVSRHSLQKALCDPSPCPGRRSRWVSPANTSTPPLPGLGLCCSIGPGQTSGSFLASSSGSHPLSTGSVFRKPAPNLQIWIAGLACGLPSHWALIFALWLLCPLL